MRCVCCPRWRGHPGNSSSHYPTVLACTCCQVTDLHVAWAASKSSMQCLSMPEGACVISLLSHRHKGYKPALLNCSRLSPLYSTLLQWLKCMIVLACIASMQSPSMSCLCKNHRYRAYTCCLHFGTTCAAAHQEIDCMISRATLTCRLYRPHYGHGFSTAADCLQQRYIIPSHAGSDLLHAHAGNVL